MTEFELKFQVDPHHRAAVEAAVGRGRSHVARLRARYFDTADGALAAQRIVLRLRKEGRTWWQTTKAAGASGSALLERHEHNVELPPTSARETPVPRIERHDGTLVGELIHEALRKAGHDPASVELVALYGTDVRRITREMRTGDALVELAFDRGEVHAGERTHPLCELEIELKSGSSRSVLELARRWRDRYALWLDTVSKSARGQRLAKGTHFGDPVKATPPDLDKDAEGPQVLCAVIKSCLSQILPNASEVAAGSTDAEHVHQLRVGIRRLRTALREMEVLAPDLIDPAWETALVTAFRALGEQRDREYLLQEIQPKLEAVGAPQIEWADTPPPPEPADVVRGADFQNVLLGLIAATLPAEAIEDDGANEGMATRSPPARKPLRKRLAKLHRQVVRDGKRYETLEAAEQHRVRKRLKRLRYLGEFVAPIFGTPDAKRYLKKLEPAQDALGRHNDNAVAIAAYRDNAAHDGQSWFAVGWLSARQSASAAACREALDEIAKAQPFWK